MEGTRRHRAVDAKACCGMNGQPHSVSWSGKAAPSVELVIVYLSQGSAVCGRPGFARPSTLGEA